MGGRRNLEREAAVVVLSGIAVANGFERITNTTGRARMDELIVALRKKMNPKKDQPAKAEFEAAVVAYHASWQAHEAQGEKEEKDEKEETEEKKEKEWKFMACQATYNGTTGEWASADERVQAGLFERLKTFALALGVLLNAVGISVTLEWATKTMSHLHAHLYLHLKTPFHRRGKDALEDWAFEGKRPHMEPNTASGKCYKGAVRYGHFYVYVDKIGSVFSWANFVPFEDYGVEGWWLDNLLKAGKLKRDIYLKLAARIGIGFQRRLADIRAAERYEKEQSAVEYAAAEAVALLGSVLPVKDFAEVNRFLGFFERGGRWFRRPMLAIIGGTNLGKSVLAADVLRRLGRMVDVPSFLEITVEENPSLDLADYDAREHAGVLLDGVGDALILKKNRESLQGRSKLTKGGQSATNMYAYKYTLARRGIVATFDLSAKNLEQFEEDHWLSSELNIIVLRLQEKAFVDVPEVPAFPFGPRPGKRRWLASPQHSPLDR